MPGAVGEHAGLLLVQPVAMKTFSPKPQVVVALLTVMFASHDRVDELAWALRRVARFLW